jgi:hypothetical protein
MSLAIVHTRAQVGIQAPLVTVEVHLSNGLPAMNMVGMNNPHDFYKTCPTWPNDGFENLEATREWVNIRLV